MTMDRDRGPVDCTVIGGGPSGLVLALLLARRGWRVEVVEQGEIGTPPPLNISPFLSPPSLRLFADLGLLPALARIGQPVHTVVETLADGDRYVLDYAEQAGPEFGHSLSVPLWRLSGVLLAALTGEESVTVSTGTSVLAVDDTGESVTLELADVAGTRSLRSRYVVCADGKFSKARDLAGIDAEVAEFDRLLVMVVVPTPDGWPERLALHHSDPDELVAVMPFAGGQTVAQWLGGPAENERLRAGDVRELLARMAEPLPELADLLTATITGWDQVLSVRHHVVRPRTWSRGRVGLVGDCAHGVHSLGGQGLNMGIQDSMLLGALLTEAGPEPFAEYERIRRPFVEAFQSYQLATPQLTAQPGGAATRGALYAEIADLVTHGQPEAAAAYRRLAVR